MKRFLLLFVVLVACMGAITRVDFTPLAPIKLVKPNGQVFGYGYGAATDGVRGAALLSAQTAAASGDTIEVLGDCEIATDSTIGKTGVRYWFGPVTLTKTTGTAALIGDGGSNLTFTVDGSGAFVTNVVCSPVKITGSSSALTLRGRYCHSQYAGVSDIASIQVTGGTTKIWLSEHSTSANYDAYWAGIGTHEIHVPLLDGNDNGVECTTLVSPGSTRVYASRIVSGDDGLQVLLGNSYRCYVQADSIEAASGFYSVNGGCSGTAFLVVDAQKLTGGVYAANTTILNATIDSSADTVATINATATGNVYSNVQCVTKSDSNSVAGSAATVVGGLVANRPITATLTYSNAVAAASISASGIAELATNAETTTGTDTARTVTPDALSHSAYGKRIVTATISGTLATGDGQLPPYRIPSDLNGWNLVGVAACVKTASSSGTPTFQVRRVRSATPADMLSTALTLDANEVDSSTAATAAVINTSNDDLATADQIYIDCDTAGTGTTDSTIQLTFQLP